MDTLYTGDIPEDYKYIFLKDGYIYLFKQAYIENSTIDCYKISNNNGFLYCKDTFTSQELINFEKVNVTKKHYFRTDYSNILFCSCAFALIFIFICNIVTSIIRRGGVLSGLL